jgi:hypothetical protein
MKGNRFDTIPEIEAATKERLRALKKDDFQSCFRSWVGTKVQIAKGTALKVTNYILK